MRGFEYIPSSIGLECLLFPTKWFTRVIRGRNRRSRALAQIETEHHSGHILWMLPADEENDAVNRDILNHMAFESGRRKLSFLTATLNEDSSYMDIFRTSGYSQLGWEQVWQYSCGKEKIRPNKSCWRKTKSADLHAISLLQNKLNSPQEKLIETSALENPPQYCLRIDGIVLGFAYVNQGLDKVTITPLLHQEIQDIESVMSNLIDIYFSKYNLLYILQRSNQAWLDSYLVDHCKNVSGKRHRIVKHLTVRNKDMITSFNHAPNGRHTDIITPATKQ